MKNTQEIYVSIDIEADGPIPGPHSMLSLGAVAFDHKGQEIGSWYENFALLPQAQPHPETLLFWQKHREMYEATRVNPQDPTVAISSFVDWVKSLPGQPVAVAAPAGFDFTFVYWYLIKFAGHSPFSFSCIDMKSVAMTLLGKPYRQSVKRNWSKHWFSNLPHTHHALDDAREQGITWCRMREDILQMHNVDNINST